MAKWVGSFVVQAALLSLSLAADAEAQAANPATPPLPEKVGEVLLVFLVMSVVFEMALTPIFNWRIFLKHLEGKGWKTPITVALAFLVFWGYKLDIIRDLLVALGYEAQLTFGGQVLTALLVAGGSDGVFRIFRKLYIREDATERKARVDEARRVP
jgi:hypothetical protein